MSVRSTGASPEFDIKDLDDAALSKIHWRITTLSAVGQFLDGYDLLIIGGALLLIVPLFKPTPAVLGFLTASTFIGSFIGALVAGWMGDKVGRRSILLWDLFFFVVCSLGAGFSQNMTELIVFRFLIGVGIGADLPVGYALIAEIAPKGTRGKLLGTPLAMWGLGGVLAGIVGFLFITYGGPEAWRWMFWVGVVPALAVLFLRRSLPETPRWLAATGQAARAKEVTASLLASTESPGVRPVPADGSGGIPLAREANRVTELLSTAYRRRIIVSFLLNVVNSITGVTFTIFTPMMVSLLAIASKGVSVAFGGLIFVAFTGGAVVNMLLADKVGRRPLLLWGTLIQFGGLGVLWATGAQVPVIVFVLFPIVFASNLLSSVSIWNCGVEYFPTRMRSTAEGVVFSGSRLGGVLAALSVPLLLAAGGVKDVMLTGVLGMVVVFLLYLIKGLPETRGEGLEALAEGTQ